MEGIAPTLLASNQCDFIHFPLLIMRHPLSVLFSFHKISRTELGYIFPPPKTIRLAGHHIALGSEAAVAMKNFVDHFFFLSSARFIIRPVASSRAVLKTGNIAATEALSVGSSSTFPCI